MTRRDRVGIIVFICLVLFVVCFLVSLKLEKDTTPPALPTTSEQNTLTLTSNGCCFWVEDVNVTLVDNDGDSILLSHNDAIHELDIFEYEIPTFLEKPRQLMVEFRAFYREEADFSKSVMEFENISDLKENGILLYFQESDDMYLNVIVGDNRVSYKMGSEENRWSVMDVPNKVYSE